MKKTKLDHKLKLSTETLLPLQGIPLDGVVGGAAGITTITTIVTRVSCLLCVPTPGSQ